MSLTIALAPKRLHIGDLNGLSFLRRRTCLSPLVAVLITPPHLQILPGLSRYESRGQQISVDHHCTAIRDILWHLQTGKT